MKNLLRGKRILVTGGSRGLGRAFCREFASTGASIAFTYAKDSAAAESSMVELSKIAAEIDARKPLCFQAPALDTAAVKTAVLNLEETWGGIDILVNNAGVSQPLLVALMEESDWDEVLDTNLKGLYIASRAVMPGMMRRKSGLILNIGSLAGTRMIAAPVHYAASKAAVRGFTETLCKEVERYKLRVLCLAPGLLDEGVARNLPEHRLEDYLSNVSLGRRGTLEEVAKFAAFMISDRNSYMNGAQVLLDGGF